MSATLLGDAGDWGIDADETGLIIESIEDTSRKESSYVKNKVGCRVGRSDYDESIEIQIEGKWTNATPFAQKISDDWTMANAISAAHIQDAGAGGRTLIDEVKRTRSNEDWKGFSITGEFLPFFGATDPA